MFLKVWNCSQSALIPFVEKRLESSLKGHWQVQVVEKLPGLRPNSNGAVGWDQAALVQRHGPLLERGISRLFSAAPSGLG